MKINGVDRKSIGKFYLILLILQLNTLLETMKGKTPAKALISPLFIIMDVGEDYFSELIYSLQIF